MTMRTFLSGLGIFVAAVLSATLSAFNAQAQGLVDPNRAPAAQQIAVPSRAAPVTARRQPRITDIPDRSEAIDPAASGTGALDDEALQRKISGICRGC